MKTPVDHIDFGERGYKTEAGDAIYIDFPKSLTEGAIEKFQTLQASEPPADDAPQKELDDWARIANRRANCFLFDLVVGWNVDDDAGVTRPLMKTIVADEERFALLSLMPLDFILKLVRKVTASTEVPEATADFSKGS